jgi:hypothetical protein
MRREPARLPVCHGDVSGLKLETHGIGLVYCSPEMIEPLAGGRK